MYVCWYNVYVYVRLCTFKVYVWRFKVYVWCTFMAIFGAPTPEYWLSCMIDICFELGVFFEMAISQPIFNIFSIGKKVRYLDIWTFLKTFEIIKIDKELEFLWTFKVGSWFLERYKNVATFNYYRTLISLLWQCLPIKVR